MSKVYDIITDQILEELDKGVLPWKSQILSLGGFPKNVISNKPYNGINVLILLSKRYISPYWLTFKQASQLGGKIKKGETHTKVVFWSTIDKENEGKEKKIPFMRYYRVWNLEQTEGCKIPKHAEIEVKEYVDPIESCEKIIRNCRNIPPIIYGKTPHYNKSTDTIGMPKIEQFQSPEFFYSTLFHELGHSTMHMSRLNREGLSYALEELVAEITACFLAGITGISEIVFNEQVSYIHGWGSKTETSITEWKNFIKQNPKSLVQAASLAQKAADYIQNITEISKLKEETEMAA